MRSYYLHTQRIVLPPNSMKKNLQSKTAKEHILFEHSTAKSVMTSMNAGTSTVSYMTLKLTYIEVLILKTDS